MPSSQIIKKEIQQLINNPDKIGQIRRIKERRKKQEDDSIESYQWKYTINYIIKDIISIIQQKYPPKYQKGKQTSKNDYIAEFEDEFITFLLIKNTLKQQFEELDKVLDEEQQFGLFSIAAFGKTNKF